MSPTMTIPANGALTLEVREIFAQVTRYPLEILVPEASLEEDLGIDSVKLGEVFAVLRERYALPEKLDVTREQVKRIAGISVALAQYIRVSAPPPPAADHHANGNAASARAEDLLSSVRQV